MKPVNPAKRAAGRYLIEFGLSIAAYVVVILISRLLWHNASGGWQTAIAVMPMIPVAFVVAAIARFLSGTDELQRRKIVESLALAGVATALVAFTYGLVEGEGLPRPSAWWTFVTFMVAWIAAAFFVRRRFL
jgi:hypothetical protein